MSSETGTPWGRRPHATCAFARPGIIDDLPSEAAAGGGVTTFAFAIEPARLRARSLIKGVGFLLLEARNNY